MEFLLTTALVDMCFLLAGVLTALMCVRPDLEEMEYLKDKIKTLEKLLEKTDE
jgi:hypothetical protein